MYTSTSLKVSGVLVAVTFSNFVAGSITASKAAKRPPGQRITYEPNWESLDSRPLPQWYDDVKFGLFFTWGPYSIPGIFDAWFQYCLFYNTSWCYAAAAAQMRQNYKPDFTYQDMASLFSAELFDPTEWAALIQQSGAKYIVLTTKHGDGYSNWPSKYSWNWNSVDVGPNKDLVDLLALRIIDLKKWPAGLIFSKYEQPGELAQALRSSAPDVHLGLYYCLGEWANPIFLAEQQSGFKTQTFPATKTLPQLKELVLSYKPDIVWSDLFELASPDTYWNATEFIAWLYNDSPVKDSVLTNDRWAGNDMCKHGGYWTCHDYYNPGVLIPHKWENCMTVDSKSWAIRHAMTISDVLTVQELTLTLMSTISCGGNLLMNVGPTADGRIMPVFQERLRQMGEWLSVNGEAVYGTKPWIFQNDTTTEGIWYTSRFLNESGYPADRLFNPLTTNTIVYAYFGSWPPNQKLLLGAPVSTSRTTISLLGYPGNLEYAQTASGLVIDLSSVSWLKLPNNWAWILKMSNLAQSDRVPDIYEAVNKEGENDKLAYYSAPLQPI